MKPSIKIQAAGESWPFEWPHRAGACNRLLQRMQLVQVPGDLPETATLEERHEHRASMVDYSEALFGVLLGSFWGGDLAAYALIAPPDGQPGQPDYRPAGKLWPITRPGNAAAWGIAVVDELYSMGWRPGEVTAAFEQVNAAITEWLGPVAPVEEVAAARDFSGASTAPTT